MRCGWQLRACMKDSDVLCPVLGDTRVCVWASCPFVVVSVLCSGAVHRHGWQCLFAVGMRVRVCQAAWPPCVRLDLVWAPPPCVQQRWAWVGMMCEDSPAWHTKGNHQKSVGAAGCCKQPVSSQQARHDLTSQLGKGRIHETGTSLVKSSSAACQTWQARQRALPSANSHHGSLPCLDSAFW